MDISPNVCAVTIYSPDEFFERFPYRKHWFFESSVSAGFPSPAEDYLPEDLDVRSYLVKNEASTFFVRVRGHSMKGAGIFDNDVVIVDRSITPKHGDIVLAYLDGEFTLKRLHKTGEKTFFTAENPEFAPIYFNENQEVLVWGVVTYCLHSCQ